MSKPKVKDIIIDADHIAFFVAESNIYKDAIDDLSSDDFDESDDFGVPAKIDLKPYKKHFKRIIEDYVTTAEVESICYGWTIGKVKVVLSDVRNFRYELYPEYKSKRPSENAVRSKLRKWARKKYICEPNTEADDVVAYYVRKGGIGFTTDKDLFNGVKGLWFNTHYKHRSWVRTSRKEAEYFFKCQVLAGDGVDGIPSLKGVGLKTAQKLLNKHGERWNDILKIFEARGYTKDYMVTMTRLVAMNQWSPKHGIKLWSL